MPLHARVSAMPQADFALRFQPTCCWAKSALYRAAAALLRFVLLQCFSWLFTGCDPVVCNCYKSWVSRR